MLKLCNWHNEKDKKKKKADGGEPRQPPCEPVGELATFLVENEDVSMHTLSFLGEKRGGGLLGGVMKIVKKEDGEHCNVARCQALYALIKMAEITKLKRHIYEFPSLLFGLTNVLAIEKNPDDGLLLERGRATMLLIEITQGCDAEMALRVIAFEGLMDAVVVIMNMEGNDSHLLLESERCLEFLQNLCAFPCDQEVANKMFEVEGLLSAIVTTLRRDGDKYKRERIRALHVIAMTVDCVEVEVKKMVFGFDGLTCAVLNSMVGGTRVEIDKEAEGTYCSHCMMN